MVINGYPNGLFEPPISSGDLSTTDAPCFSSHLLTMAEESYFEREKARLLQEIATVRVDS